MNEHAVHSTAGPLIEETPCDGACGRTVERIYRSHSDWRDQGRTSKRRIPHLCAECKARRDALGQVEHEKYVAQQQAEAAAYCAQMVIIGVQMISAGDELKMEWTGFRITNPYVSKTQTSSVLTRTQSSFSCSA